MKAVLPGAEAKLHAVFSHHSAGKESAVSGKLPLAGRLGALLRRQGIEPGVVAQPGEELDPGRGVLGPDQPPDDAPQRIAAVEDAQVLAGDDPGLGAEQGDRQVALGLERLGAAGLGGPGR
jgi:hypothetical protein